jgi:prepilin-type N-terminal cleavage/methylation domain-containing protein
MINRLFSKKNNKGVGLLEILIVVAIIGVGFLAVISFLLFSRGVTFQVARNTVAVNLAEEGIEAVRGLRDESWSTNINSLTSGTDYYPVVSGDKWSLSTTDPGPIENLFTRTLTVEAVSRDAASGDIASGGTSDPNTKKVTAKVAWLESGRNNEVVLTTYITNFLEN